MYNQVTDRYRFVEVKVITALPVLGRMTSSVEGYSLQLFRSNEYVRSLRPHNPRSGPISRTRPKSVQKPQQMRVYNGDVIYQIDMRPHSIPIVGSFKTKDNYVRIYDITLDLVVDDPVLFAKGYSVGKDPVHLAIESFKTAFLDYATKTEHDKLRVLRPPDSAWSAGLSKDTGMMIQQISQWSLREDPKRLEIAEIEQDAEKNKLAIRIKAENQRLEDQFQRIRDSEKRFHERRELELQRKFEREEEEKQEAFKRKELTRQHIFELHYQLRNAAAQELKEILRERIRDTFERGRSIEEVAEESLKLLVAFHASLPKVMVSSDEWIEAEYRTNIPELKNYQLSLFALTRTTLESDDKARVGKTYSVQAGISQNRPEDFKGEPFYLSVGHVDRPILFDVLLHVSENIELANEWFLPLLYNPGNPEPQLVEFTFKVVATGHCSLVIDFYHERRWLRTIRLEFAAVEQSQFISVSSEV